MPTATKLFLLTLWSCLLASVGVAAQATSRLAARIQRADQVLIVSHDDFQFVLDERDHPVPVPPYVVGGKPNPAIALKSKLLTPAERARLSAILTRPYRPGATTVMHCCEPHHALFLVEKNRTAYVDVCLLCRCIGDVRNFPLPEFDNRRWEELQQFINRLGLAYVDP